jgi:hypothetical protein
MKSLRYPWKNGCVWWIRCCCSLNTPESVVDSAWMEVAQRRLDELRAGRVEAVPGEAVFERIRQRYEK